MLLAIDVGNANVKFALFEQSRSVPGGLPPRPRTAGNGLARPVAADRGMTAPTSMVIISTVVRAL